VQIAAFSRSSPGVMGGSPRPAAGRCRRARRRARLLAAACAFAVLPACGASQEIAAEADSVRSEAARIEAALAEIESRALRDPELLRMDRALGEELMAAMVEADPGLAAAAGRLPLLREEHDRAVRSGDEAAAGDLGRRIAAIEQRYLRAQAAVLREAPFADRVATFKALLRRRMIETDTAAAGLLRRYAELHDRPDP
jgi:hypothetical protein